MPLLKETYQPFFRNPKAPAVKVCNGEYCYPVASGDIIRQQWYQTPCNPSLVCNPLFDDFTLGAEMIVNGDFATNADDWFVNAVEIGSTTCPATVDSWCWNTGKLGHDGTDGNSDMVSQTGMGLAAGNVYKVVYTTQGMTQGSIYVQLGDGVGATQGTVIETNGINTEFLFYNDAQDTISFVPSEDFDGNIDDVSLKLFTLDCWTGDYWTFDPDSGTACKTISTAGANLINNDTDYITNGDYYQVSVTVQGYVSGSVSVYVDDGTDSTATNVQTAITANGTYTYWFTALQDGVIAFDPTTDFVGCISSPSVYRLRNDFEFTLIDSEGGEIDLSTSAVYEEDKIVLNVDFASLMESGLITDYGCYTIFVYDACLVSGDNILTDGDFNNQDFSVWTRNMQSYQYNYDGNGIEFILEPLEGSNLVSNGDFSGGSTDWTGFGGGDWVISGGGAQHTPGNTTPITQVLTLGAPSAPGSPNFTWHEITVSGRTAGGITVNIGGTNSNQYLFNDQMANVMVLLVGGAQTLTITPTSAFDGTIDDIKVHQTPNPWFNLPQIAHTSLPALVPANYQCDFTIVSNIQDGVTGLYVQLDYNNPADSGLVTGANSTQFPDYVPTQQVVRLSGQFAHSGGYFRLGRIAIDDVSVYQVEPFEATYESECLNFQNTHVDTVVVTGYSDQSAFGLDWDIDDYKLQMRIHCVGYGAYVDDEVNIARFGTGDAEVTYAALENYWLLTTDFLSESALMTLKAMTRCDHFMVGEGVSTDTEYIVKEEEFQPAWLQPNVYSLAPVTLNLRLKDGGMKFNRHT